MGVGHFAKLHSPDCVSPFLKACGVLKKYGISPN